VSGKVLLSGDGVGVGDRHFNLRGDRTETCGDKGRSPEFQFEGRSHLILMG